MKPTKTKPTEETLIRILSTDIPGNKKVFAGLTRVKGISWSFSNALCTSLKINKQKKVQDLTKEEIEKINEFGKNVKLPSFLINRRNDRDLGINQHLLTAEFDLKKEFDIKRLRKIRVFKGWRHAIGQPVRGQRTKSHFRKNKAIGVTKTKEKSKRNLSSKSK